MFSQIYRPKKLEELTFNNEITLQLNSIINKGLSQNIIFNGIRSSGKKTRIYCLLNSLFGNLNPITCNHILNKNLEISYISTNHYIEICPSLYGIHDKEILSDFIYQLSQTKNLLTNSYKIFIIQKADKLTIKAQYILKNIITKSYKTSLFILTTEDSSSLINQLKDKFMILKLKNPTYEETLSILNNLSIKLDINTSSRNLNYIIQMSKKNDNMINLTHVINIFQLSYNDSKYFKYNNKFMFYLDKLLDLINNENIQLSNFDDIRNYIYILYTSNFQFINIFIYIVNYYVQNIKNTIIKCKILISASKYSYLMTKGNKHPLYLEAFILNIIKIQKLS